MGPTEEEGLRKDFISGVHDDGDGEDDTEMVMAKMLRMIWKAARM